jgi:hypothetical protein
MTSLQPTLPSTTFEGTPEFLVHLLESSHTYGHAAKG